MYTQVNHLCPFLLTLELLPIVLETASTSGDGRILFVSSSGHYKRYAGEVNFNSIDSEEMYRRTKAYGRTKLYNVRMLIYMYRYSFFPPIQVMTTFSLQRRLKDVSITVSVQHPGVVSGTLLRHMHIGKLYTLYVIFGTLQVRTEIARGISDTKAILLFYKVVLASKLNLCTLNHHRHILIYSLWSRA